MENILRSGEIRPILTIDIVNYSMRSSHQQVTLYKALVEIIRKALQALPDAAKHPSNRIWSPSGDGGSLTFLNTSIDVALMTAIYISHNIKNYNNGEFYDDTSKALLPPPNEPLQLRTGIHLGPVSKDIDFDDRENIWGDGINISARVMGMAKPEQIVISEEYFKNAGLSKDEDHPGIEITYIGKWWAKHNLPVHLYNVYADGAGIHVREVDEWFGPLHYPLENAIRVYEGMLAGEESPFRVAVIAKRLLDLDSQNANAKKALESLSKKRFTASGNKRLYHDLFSEFSPATIRYFFEKSNFKVYEAEETVMTEGEKANSMMMIVSGEIKLFRSGQVVKRHNKVTKKDEEYKFPEGSLIGEMGLFEETEKRSATLRTSKRSIVLDIDYDFIKIKGSPNSGENMMRQEIQRRIWDLYTERTIENKLIYHPLFEDVDEEARNVLKDYPPQFFLSDAETPSPLTVEEVWKNLIVVISGKIKAYSLKEGDSQFFIEYGTDECLGTFHLVSERNPYTQIEVPAGVQFICFPWDIIYPLRDKFEKFDAKLLRLGSKERQQRGLA